MKMNHPTVVFAAIFVVCVASFTTDGPIGPRFLQTFVSFVINIVPVSKFLKSEENVDYSVRKFKQFIQNYQ